MVADLQIEAEEANGGVLLTVVDSARLTMLLTRETAAELLDAIDACMKTGERQTTRAVDVWRAAPDLPVFGVHVSIDGASWTSLFSQNLVFIPQKRPLFSQNLP